MNPYEGYKFYYDQEFDQMCLVSFEGGVYGPLKICRMIIEKPMGMIRGKMWSVREPIISIPKTFIYLGRCKRMGDEELFDV